MTDRFVILALLHQKYPQDKLHLGTLGTELDRACQVPAACVGIAAFAKAGPAKNPALCDDNGICLSMTGSGLKAAVDAQFKVETDLIPVLLPEAEANLKTLAAGIDPMNEATAKELDERAERIARLRLKYDPGSRKAASGKNGAVNVREKK